MSSRVTATASSLSPNFSLESGLHSEDRGSVEMVTLLLGISVDPQVTQGKALDLTMPTQALEVWPQLPL